MRNAITEQSHATRFKTADLDISGILCSTVVSKTIKCFTKFHLQIIEDINFDQQKNLHLLGTHFNRRDFVMLCLKKMGQRIQAIKQLPA